MGVSPSERRACATRSSWRQRLFGTPSSAPGAQPRTGSDFGGDLEAIATTQWECNTHAVCAFRLQRIRRKFVQTDKVVGKVQLAAQSIRSSRNPRRAWLRRPAFVSRICVQSRRLFVLRQWRDRGPTVLRRPQRGSTARSRARRGQPTHPQCDAVDGPCRDRGLTTAPRLPPPA